MAIVQQIDNHFISPIVMQRAVKLHPAVVMLALLAGGTLAGFFGLLLAVPAAATLKIVIGHVWRHYVLGEPLDEIEARWEAEDDTACTGGVDRTGRVDDGVGDAPVPDERPTDARCGRAWVPLTQAHHRLGPSASSASSVEAGPVGVGSLIASSARSTLQPVRACSELGESVAGGGIVEVDGSRSSGTISLTAMWFCSSLALAAGWLSLPASTTLRGHL